VNQIITAFMIPIMLVSCGCLGGVGISDSPGSNATSVSDPTTAPSESSIPELKIYASDDINFDLIVERIDTNNTVIDRQYDLNATEKLSVQSDLSEEPYRVYVFMGSSEVWNRTVSPGERVELTVNSEGNVTVGPISST